MPRLKDVLKVYAVRKGLASGVGVARILETWRTAVPAIVGGRLSAQTRPVSFRSGVLTVEVASAPLAAELQLRHHELLRAFSDEAHKKAAKVLRIRFRVTSYFNVKKYPTRSSEPPRQFTPG